MSASGPEVAAVPPVRAAWPRRFFGAYVHPGALGALGLVALGLGLDLLALPPGPLPILVLAADAPFLWLLYRDGGARWKRWAFLYGALHFGLATRWLAEIHPVQVLGCALVLAPVYVLLGLAIRRLTARGAPFALTVATGVVLEEMLRTVWMGGMPWPARSMSFAGDAPLGAGLDGLVPASAWVGAYGLSFLAGLCSALVFLLPRLRAARGLPRPRDVTAVAWTGLGTLLVLAALVLGATIRGARVRLLPAAGAGGGSSPGRLLVAVQGNVAQALKHAKDSGSVLELLDLHLRLTGQAVRSLGAGEQPFAILWPETMIPWPFVDPDLAARFPDVWDDEVGVLRRLRADVPEASELDWLIGTVFQFRRGDERHEDLWDYGSHDSLFHVRPVDAPAMGEETPPPGSAPPPWERGRHDKTRLVPGGEYTPLGELIPPLRWFRNFVSVIPELDPGAEDQAPFELGPSATGGAPLRAGTIICFEIGFPATCRAWRRRGARVLLNAANYGWFGETGFRDQIQTIARLRAAELGVTVVMAGNTGPTAFYDPLGRRYGTFIAADGTPLPAGRLDSTFREGWVAAPILADREDRTTLYVDLGDTPWILLGIALLGRALVGGRRARPGMGPSPDEGSG